MSERIEPWVLDVAQEMIGVVKNANHKGELTYTWAGKTLVQVEWSRDGIQVTFPESVRDAAA